MKEELVEVVSNVIMNIKSEHRNISIDYDPMVRSITLKLDQDGDSKEFLITDIVVDEVSALSKMFEAVRQMLQMNKQSGQDLFK